MTRFMYWLAVFCMWFSLACIPAYAALAVAAGRPVWALYLPFWAFMAWVFRGHASFVRGRLSDR